MVVVGFHLEPTRGSIRRAGLRVIVDRYPERKQRVMSSSVLIVNIAVLLAVLEADLGRRTVSKFRILRPLLMAIGLVPIFVDRPATAGPGELLELVLTGLGVLLGLFAATRLMHLSFDAAKQRVTSSAGVGYAIFWSAIIGARLAFTYGANHWYTTQLGHWMATNGVSVDALTDSLIFMAIAMAVTRSIRLAVGRSQVRYHAGAHRLGVQA
jgi:hypothetical protein